MASENRAASNPAPQRRGILISFEGPDGAGKTTQLRLLARRLRERGCEVVRTREPGGTPLGERLRAILLDPSGGEVDSRTEVLMLAAARADHVAHVIWPALQAGAVVLTDRYVDSTYAYQGYGSGLDLKWLDSIMAFATGGLLPALTVLLDLDPTIGLVRKRREAGGTATRFELRSLSYHRRVRAGFLARAKADPARWLVVDATLPCKRVGDLIWQQVEPLMASPKVGPDTEASRGASYDGARGSAELRSSPAGAVTGSG